MCVKTRYYCATQGTIHQSVKEIMIMYCVMLNDGDCKSVILWDFNQFDYKGQAY